MEAGRKVWLQQGLEDGAHLEAFALFFYVFSASHHSSTESDAETPLVEETRLSRVKPSCSSVLG